jgi:serine/threonine protein kinase
MAAGAVAFAFGVPPGLMAKVDLDASSSELLGTDIGPYRLVRRLGMGGMAETFVAIRRGPRGFTQRVCLKLVLPFFREDEEFVKLFRREARLAAKLRHSNIVGVLDFGEIDGRSYMALELVDGVDLQVLLDAESGNRISPEYVALLGHDLASALNHAHNPPRESDFDGSRGGAIVHRDISPSNVLISRHGEIMLSDFGVAKAVTSNSHKQSAVKGKVPYMSPEQLRLEPLDGRADLFGVGVVLFEALCGKRPFQGGHDPATIMLILQGDHERLATLAPSAPHELCDVIDSLIEPDRENRPESAGQLIELLDPFVPSPRTRRELGKRVAELRPEEEAVSGYPPALGEATTAPHHDVDATGREKRTSGIVGAGESQERVESWSEGPARHPSEPPPKSPLRKAWAALLLAVGLVAAAGAGWWVTRDAAEDAPPPSVQADTVSAEQAAGIPASGEHAPDVILEAVHEPAAETETPSETSTAEPKDPPAPAAKAVPPASLTVVVYPWGDVWINGKRRGAAPLRNISLKPGRYRIGAGQREPTVTQTVRLRSGEQKRLKLDVTH